MPGHMRMMVKRIVGVLGMDEGLSYSLYWAQGKLPTYIAWV